MSLTRKIERQRQMAENKRISRQREQLGDTTLKVIALLKSSPLINRQTFAVDLFAKDCLGDRINTAWLIIRGRKIERIDFDEHAQVADA